MMDFSFLSDLLSFDLFHGFFLSCSSPMRFSIVWISPRDHPIYIVVTFVGVRGDRNKTSKDADLRNGDAQKKLARSYELQFAPNWKSINFKFGAHFR
jgi:hypothetical protein